MPMHFESLEEMFRFGAEKLLEQAQPSGARNQNGRFVCYYRGPNGCKCAAGHFISDDEYTPHFEGLIISALNSVHPTVNNVNDADIGRVLEAMQKAHDRWADSNNSMDKLTLLERLNFIADYFGFARL